MKLDISLSRFSGRGGGIVAGVGIIWGKSGKSMPP